MTSNYKKIGDYIQLVDERNKELKVTTLLGLSITKEFIPSVANTIGTNMKNYKIIRKNQFACSTMQVRRDKKMPIALLQEFDEAIISQAYPVFEVMKENELLPEYLMMWFTRSEFDRHACFLAVGGVRGSLEWEDFLEMPIPIPSIKKQQEIVNEYNTVVNRIKLNEQLNQKLEETAQALYKHWFVDFEFPVDSERHPELVSGSHPIGYKSSGGKMVYNEELDKEIPEGWEVESLSSICQIKGGKRMPSGENLISIKNNHPYIKVADLGTSKYATLNDNFEYVPKEVQSKISRYIVSTGDLIISIVGTIGIIKVIHKSLNNANLTENCVKITNLESISSGYLYHYLNSKEGKEEIKMRNVGAVQAKLPIYNIESFDILCPESKLFEKYKKYMTPIDSSIEKSQIENIQLNRLKVLLLSKMTKVEIEKEIVS
ncbi:restriction endonuclease subunit S [Lutibacter sp. A64]|uniref:restriction endonuclease subunit S n=1 Tax=Lutibacter sp. A64 TaxID=2918526 RepID=UPI001F05849F|nr:restriction endonuclease subunit S [Lutibacter sp. A64]UMB55336.1 restriction endonuclease subunit S [Lutibacter sp. A64]